MNTSRIYLRALEPDDYKVTFAWRNDSEIQSMVGGPKYFVSMEKEKQWVQNAIVDNSCVRLAVCLKKSDLHIGNVYATNFDMLNRACKTHVLIGDKDYWNGGYATEAYKLLQEYLFEERGMNRLSALIIDTNIASLKMHKKCGYTEEGVLRQSVYKNGKFHDQIMVAILKEDYDRIKHSND